MNTQEREALVKSYLGKIVTIEIDRPIGYVHWKKGREHPLIYPINYGYIPNVLGGDGEELDVYLVGVNVPVERYTGRIVGIVYRLDDVEDKLIMAPVGRAFGKEEIERSIHFQEMYYDTRVEAWHEESDS